VPPDPPVPADGTGAAAPPAAVPGLARSLAELHVAADLRACERCGAREPVGWRVLPQPGHRYWVHAPCPRCRSEREYIFHADGDLLGRRPGRSQLGGPAPSTVLTAAQLAAEVERLAPQITTDATVTRDGEGANRNRERYELILTALTELAKFIPDGGPDVPGLAGRGPAVPHARPERYTRAWISGELEHWTKLGLALPRPYFAVRRPRLKLEHAQADAHRDWLRRGRDGDGRLVLADIDLEPARLFGVDLTGARWERVGAARGEYNFLDLSDSDLTDVDFSQSVLRDARFRGARLTRCTLDGSGLQLARLDGAQLTGCSLQRVKTDRSSWRGARVVATRLSLAEFGSSELAGARFTGCDLREAWFKPARPAVPAPLASPASPASSASPGPPGRSAGAVFEGCDLRDADFTGADLAGVTFARCLFRGARGRPAATAGWQVTDADFSAAGDGSDLGGAGALLDQLGRDYDPRMTERTVRYRTGNEHNPADPFGRSELVLHADGRARLDHHFSRQRRAGAWTGQVDAAAVGALFAALDEAGFPAVPGPGFLPPDSTVRTLIVEGDGGVQQASLGWHQTPPQPGYGVAFDILDGVIRQLSGADVPYRSTQPPIVAGITVLA
jgi:uncharacterized protein YjbI with pentapeptide repeats